MTAPVHPDQLIGRTAYGSDGDKIGKIDHVYLDDASGSPAWLAISTGLFGNKQSFAPASGVNAQGDDIHLNVNKDAVKDAPRIDDDGHLNDQETQELYQYYAGVQGYSGGTYEQGGADWGQTTDTQAGYVEGTGQAGYADANRDEVLTRSEEQLHVGTEQVETGRARLRKYVVTENVQTTVPVSHEEVRVVREPVTDGTPVGEIGEAETSVTLHAERPVVAKETVAVEQVGLATNTVTDEQQVNEQVRKEQIDVDGVEGQGVDPRA